MPSTIPGAVRRIRPGVAPEWTFPRHEPRCYEVARREGFVEPGSRRAVRRPQRRPPAHGDGARLPGRRWRRLPHTLPAPGAAAQSMGGTAADPNTTIIRPSNVAVPVSLPINLGRGSWPVDQFGGMGDSRRSHPDARLGTRDSRPAGAVLHGAVLAARGAPGWTADRAAVVGCDDGRACRVGGKH